MSGHYQITQIMLHYTVKQFNLTVKTANAPASSPQLYKIAVAVSGKEPPQAAMEQQKMCGTQAHSIDRFYAATFNRCEQKLIYSDVRRYA